MVRFADSIEIASGVIPIYETKPGSIIVPGLSGMVETTPSSSANSPPDAHAHIIHYGWKMELVLDGSDSIEGPSMDLHTVPHV